MCMRDTAAPFKRLKPMGVLIRLRPQGVQNVPQIKICAQQYLALELPIGRIDENILLILI